MAADDTASGSVHVGDAPVERVALDDHSWVDVARGWLVGADELFEHLRDHVPWSTSQLYRYDHYVEERRLGASWRRGSPLPHPVLADATRWLQNRYRAYFDGFSLIRYRNGADGQAFHRDTDMRYLDDTVIGILSLGARRPWLLRPWASRTLNDAPGKGATHDLAPGSGDLIVMGGRAQADWQHSVPYLSGPTRTEPGRRDDAIGERISLQWRFANKVGKPFIGASYSAPLHYSRKRP